MKVIGDIVDFAHEIATLRRDIHAHPELAYAETRTAALIADKLRAWGLEVTTGIGGTGLVGTLRGQGAGAIGLRADMDALPMQEHNDFAHRSTVDGRMHACGHDGHVAMLLAAARYMTSRPPPAGTVHFIFQPAEENGAGAQAMIDDGLFDRFPCEQVFGMHNWPGMPVGTFGICAGPMLASANEFEIRIHGRGTHAALPHTGIDPIWVACQLVNAMQGIVTREKRPYSAAVLSVTQIHAGDAFNVIPDSAVIRGTVRTFELEVTDLFERRIGELCANLPGAFGATAELDFVRSYPPLLNHAEATRTARSIAADLVGADQVIEFEPTMGAEDFAFMLLARPGCYIAIGNGEGGHREQGHGAGACVLHNPSYDFNDDIIALGASYWVRLAEHCLDATR